MDSPRTNFTLGAAMKRVEIGYVTWSSTRSGERPCQSVEMMTCVSLRSGIASSGVRRSAQIDAETARMPRMKTRKGLRALVSMIRSISVMRAGGTGGGVFMACAQKSLRAPSIFDSASTRKLPLATTRSPARRPSVTW